MRVSVDSETSVCTLLVVISRPDDRPPIDGRQISARVSEVSGGELALLRGPSGTQVQAGGSLGMSANITFLLQGTGKAVRRVELDYLGETAAFELEQERPDGGSK